MEQSTQRTFDWDEHMRKHPYLSRVISEYVHNKDCTCEACQLKVTTDPALLMTSKGGEKNAD